MTVEVKFDDAEVMNAIQGLLAAGADLTPAMRDITDVMWAATERAFRNQEDPETGVPWAPLKQSTIKHREKTGHWPGSILQVSGGLARDMERDYGRDYARLGTNKIYATTQYFGAEKGEFGETENGVPLPWGTILARHFYGLNGGDRQEILDVLGDYLRASYQP